MLVHLNILAVDILNSSYLQSSGCPITKALARAGYPHLQDGGTGLYHADRDLRVHDHSKDEMDVINTKLMSMYNAKYGNSDTPIEDFILTLDIPDHILTN